MVRLGRSECITTTDIPAIWSASTESGARTERRKPMRPASTCRRDARGQVRTTKPCEFARQPRSTPSRKSGTAGLKPPSCRQAAMVTSRPAVDAPSTLTGSS